MSGERAIGLAAAGFPGGPLNGVGDQADGKDTKRPSFSGSRCVQKGRGELMEKMDFKSGDLVVYPAHGVGEITAIDEVSIAGEALKVYSISFRETKMTLRLPVTKAKTAGLRKLTSRDRFKEAMKTLQGRAKKSRTMWSRRAQEYDAKIKSGDPVAIAEVVRDLHRKDETIEQSYSERQIYQAALGRLARELAAIEKIDEKKAADKIELMMKKAA